VRTAALRVGVLGPIVLSGVGIALVFVGFTAAGVALLIAGFVLRAVTLAVRRRDLFASPSKVAALLSGGVIIAWLLLVLNVKQIWSVAWTTWAIVVLALIWIAAFVVWAARKLRANRNLAKPS
jgi:hypothetical protein